MKSIEWGVKWEWDKQTNKTEANKYDNKIKNSSDRSTYKQTCIYHIQYNW